MTKTAVFFLMVELKCAQSDGILIGIVLNLRQLDFLSMNIVYLFIYLDLWFLFSYQCFYKFQYTNLAHTLLGICLSILNFLVLLLSGTLKLFQFPIDPCWYVEMKGVHTCCYVEMTFYPMVRLNIHQFQKLSTDNSGIIYIHTTYIYR